jgi:hypothetical protein
MSSASRTPGFGVWLGREAATPRSARPSATSARTTWELAVTSSMGSWCCALRLVSSRDERLGRGVAGRQPDDVAAVADPGHHLADVVGALQERARVLVEAPSGGGQRDAARRALEQAGADLRLQRREALRQRRLRDVQAHRRAPSVPRSAAMQKPRSSSRSGPGAFLIGMARRR